MELGAGIPRENAAPQRPVQSSVSMAWKRRVKETVRGSQNNSPSSCEASETLRPGWRMTEMGVTLR